jgi:crotonobetainyl-CoA:carnitine CoA-transferase CaiB-like acyl-CoA transferase
MEAAMRSGAGSEASGSPGGALAGIVVIELGMVMQVPLAAQMLGDLGADVIKVERPGTGDILRTLDPIANEAGTMSCYYAALCRNKRNVCIDIKQPEGREVLLRLIEKADVLIHNFRPGVMERLGLGYAELEQRNPRLVYAGGYAFGETGPMSKFPGQDMLSQSFSGFVMSGRDGSEPPQLSNPPLMDYGAAVSLTQGILAALIERQRSGRGQAISTSLFSVALGIQTLELASRTMHGRDTSWVRHAMIYRVTDGWVVVLTLFRDNPLQLLCRAFGLDDMSRQPNLADVEQQIAHKAEIQAVFGPLFAQHSTAEVLERLGQVDILCSPVNDLSAVIDHPQTQANEAVWTIDVPGQGKVKVAGNAVRLSRTPAEYRQPPAWMGAHNAEVLDAFGFGEGEIQRLQAAGILSEDARLQPAAD